MNFYQRFLGDYMRDTMHLSMVEHGAYTLLLDTYYATEKPLPSDYEALYRICRAMSKAERAVVKKVAEEFFKVDTDGLRHNPRADEEIAQAQPKIKAAQENGRKGGRPRTHQEPTGFISGTDQEPNANPEVTKDEPVGKAHQNHNHKQTDKEKHRAGRFTFEDSEVAVYILNRVLEVHPGFKTPNLNDWADDVRLMREQDKRTHAEIRDLFDWSNRHHFWSGNIHSPKKLRKQWDTLVMQRNTKSGATHGTHQRIDNSAPARVQRAIDAKNQGRIIEGKVVD